MASILQTLGNLNDGRLLGQATDEMAELVMACRETGKAGTLTIELAIKPATRSGAMSVTGKVKSKKPVIPTTETLFFTDEEGRLLTEDPRQLKLELRSVPDVDRSNLRQA